MANRIVACSACEAKNRIPAVASGTPRCAKCKTALTWIADANDQDFDVIADSSKVAVLVDLWAPWCGPCRQVSPLLEQLAAEHAGKLKVVKVNVDNSPQTQARFEVQAIPTLLLFAGGEQVGVQRGALPMAALRQWVAPHLAN